LKKAEDSDEVVLRMAEMDGAAEPNVHIAFSSPVISAREMNAQEQPTGPASITDGALVTSFTAYQPRTFALHLAPSTVKVAAVHSSPVPLSYTLAVATNDDTPTNGAGFDSHGDALPAEMLPQHVEYNGAQFDLAAAATGSPNALAATGQTIALPAGHFNRIYILAASAAGDQQAEFRVGQQASNLDIQDWGGFVGQWDTRVWKNEPTIDWAISAHHAVWPPKDLEDREKRQYSPSYPEDYVSLKPGYLKPATLAWVASHHHTPAGLNQPYQYSYLFAYSLDVPANAHSLTLPNDDKIRILAISVAEGDPEITPAAPLFDTLRSDDDITVASQTKP
jgi:alpha-mannosidase